MQPNLAQIRDLAVSRFGWQPLLATLRRTEPESIRRAPFLDTESEHEALNPFAGCRAGLPRAELLAELRAVLDAERDAIRAEFETGGDGLRAAREHSRLMDALVRHLLELAERRLPASARKAHGRQLAVAAVGSYGRGELAPFSDLDVLFLVPKQRSTHAVQIIEFLLYQLWDLGVRVGHAVRSVDECLDLARSDRKTRTSLLDLRFLWGERHRFDELAVGFRAEIDSAGEALVDALLHEQAMRHLRFEEPTAPDVKRGRGGLRDVQTLLWLAKIRGQVRRIGDLDNPGFLEPAEASGYARASRLLWSVRCHLHYLAGRPEERLSADIQPKVARRMQRRERAAGGSAAALLQEYRRTTGQVELWCARVCRQ